MSLRRLCLSLSFVLAGIVAGRAQTAYDLGDRYALIVGGPGGLEEYTEKYFSQTSRMYDLLVNQLGYHADHVVFLFERVDYDSLNIQAVATAVNVRRAFRELGQKMSPQDQLLVFLVGHGSFGGTWSKFNLVGPDLRDLDFAELLNTLPTKRVVLINTASASGPFIERLSAEERVIVTATKSGMEHYETNFADFFLEALSSNHCDFNKDGRISMLEAFEFAREQQDRWFEEKRRIRAEHPLLDDNGDGRGSEELEGAADGAWANRVFLNPVSEELKASVAKMRSGTPTLADSLRLQKAALEEQIADLKARKTKMDVASYNQKLEALLVRLARVNRALRRQEGR